MSDMSELLSSDYQGMYLVMSQIFKQYVRCIDHVSVMIHHAVDMERSLCCGRPAGRSFLIDRVITVHDGRRPILMVAWCVLAGASVPGLSGLPGVDLNVGRLFKDAVGLGEVNFSLLCSKDYRFGVHSIAGCSSTLRSTVVSSPHRSPSIQGLI